MPNCQSHNINSKMTWAENEDMCKLLHFCYTELIQCIRVYGSDVVAVNCLLNKTIWLHFKNFQKSKVYKGKNKTQMPQSSHFSMYNGYLMHDPCGLAVDEFHGLRWNGLPKAIGERSYFSTSVTQKVNTCWHRELDTNNIQYFDGFAVTLKYCWVKFLPEIICRQKAYR